MRLKALLFTLLLVPFLYSSAQKVTRIFVEKYLPLVKSLETEWGIPASIILGVSILESGSGTSINARQLNNFFGITGKNSLKRRRTMYKQYATPEASFEGFCKTLSTKRFFNKLKGNLDYNAWLTAMNTAHYAGAKGVWITRVKSVIKKHNLIRYD